MAIWNNLFKKRQKCDIFIDGSSDKEKNAIISLMIGTPLLDKSIAWSGFRKGEHLDI